MQQRRFFVPILIWAMVLSCNVSAKEDGAAEIRSLLERVAALMQAGDLVPIGEIYAPGRGVHIIEGAGVNHGWEEYRDKHLAPEIATFKNFSYRNFAIEPHVHGDIAYTSYRYELIADLESGRLEIAGRGTAILKRLNGQWRIVHSHTSGRRK